MNLLLCQSANLLRRESAAMQRTETGKILFGHFCQKIQQKGFPRAVAKILEVLARWVHYHKKEQASRKPGKLQTSMANVLLIFLSFPMLKSVDLTDQQLI